MATLTSVQGTVLKKIILGLLFLGCIVGVNAIALSLGPIINPTTVAFAFLIIVVASAVFAGLAVAVVVSIAATLFFNYFYLPPIGRFIIYDSHNWVSLFTFLFTSVVISRLTASANENRHKAHDLEFTLARLKEFGSWLLRSNAITVSEISQGAIKIFSLQYCSIHIYGDGASYNLKISNDHPAGLLKLAEEHSLGVRYSNIRIGSKNIAALVVKSDYLSRDALDAIAFMIGITLTKSRKEAHLVDFPDRTDARKSHL